MEAGESWAGRGIYELGDAARLVGMSAHSARRWLGGYDYTAKDGSKKQAEPLWHTGLPTVEGQIGLCFRDLIQLCVVAHLRSEIKISLQRLRLAIRHAQEVMDTDYPLARSDFQTDGRRLFLEILDGSDEREDRRLYDLLSRQYVFRRAVAPLFKQLDFGIDHHAERWWPLGRKRRVVLDPRRAFGRPMTAMGGVPTEAIRDAAASLGSLGAVATWFEIPRAEVEDALRFEEHQHRPIMLEAA
jgi:uncharacterized protein (DUF433 family)